MYILGLLPLIILGLIVYGIVKLIKRKRRRHPTKDRAWYLRLSFCKEDSVSQWLLLLGFFFFAITLASFNRDLEELIPWHYVVLITTVIGLVAAYYFRLIYVLIFSLIGVATWWGIKATDWFEIYDFKAAGIFTVYVFILLIFYLLARFHESKAMFKRFSLVYLVLSLLPLSATLIFLSTRPGLFVIEEMIEGVSIFTSWQFTVSLVLVILAVVGLMIYLVNKKLISIYEVGAVVLLLLLFSVITLVLPEQDLFTKGSLYNFYRKSTLNGVGVTWAVIFNILAFIKLVGLIFLGYLRRETGMINFGAALLFIFIIIKYFDWFFTFLDKSLFFIGAGILLFVVGWSMEKGRRYMLTNIKSENTTPTIES